MWSFFNTCGHSSLNVNPYFLRVKLDKFRRKYFQDVRIFYAYVREDNPRALAGGLSSTQTHEPYNNSN